MTKPIHTTDKHGNQYWRLIDKLHREDGPAFIDADGDQEWWVDGKLHRLDGPACIYANDNRYWWVNGNYITDKYDLSLFDSEEGRMILLIKYGSPN